MGMVHALEQAIRGRRASPQSSAAFGGGFGLDHKDPQKLVGSLVTISFRSPGILCILLLTRSGEAIGITLKAIRVVVWKHIKRKCYTCSLIIVHRSVKKGDIK